MASPPPSQCNVPSTEVTPPVPVYSHGRKRRHFSSLDQKSQSREVRRSLEFSNTNSIDTCSVPDNEVSVERHEEQAVVGSQSGISEVEVSEQGAAVGFKTGIPAVEACALSEFSSVTTPIKDLNGQSFSELLDSLDCSTDELEIDIFLLMERADGDYFDEVFDPRCLFSDDVCLPSGSNSESRLDRILNSYPDDSGSDSDEECTSEQTVANKIQDTLCHWTAKQKVEHSKVTVLLQSLKTIPMLSSLPATARSLVHTPRKSCIKDLPGGGKYVHFGIARSLSIILVNEKKGGHVELIWSTDGNSMFKSLPSEVWSILGRILNIPSVSHIVFPIGFFHSGHKPKNSSFLDDFIDEAKVLIENGLNVGGHFFTVSVKGFAGDAPAKALVLGVINFNGKSSCTRCHVLGEWSPASSRTYYLNDNAAPRTHDEFLNQSSDDDYHQSTTRLTEISTMKFPASFSMDYLHLILLGAFRTLIYLWIFGKKLNNIGAPARREVFQKSTSMKMWAPKVFNRKPRSLEEGHFFKGTEWRQLLCYTGMVIFKDSVLSNKYQHFLYLVVAVRIILDPNMIKDKRMVIYARDLLRCFVKQYRVEYGVDHITYNLHGLLHICDDLDFFTNLEECSAFSFENFLQFIKHLVRKCSAILIQIEYRLEEMFLHNLLFNQVPKSFYDEPQFSSPHSEGPLVSSVCDPQFSSLRYKFFEVTRTVPNNCCSVIGSSNEIILVSNFCKDKQSGKMMIVGHRFLNKKDFFVSPCRSSNLGIYLVSNLSRELETWPVENLHTQNYRMPYKNSFVVVPLINSDC